METVGIPPKNKKVKPVRHRPSCRPIKILIQNRRCIVQAFAKPIAPKGASATQAGEVQCGKLLPPPDWMVKIVKGMKKKAEQTSWALQKASISPDNTKDAE